MSCGSSVLLIFQIQSLLLWSCDVLFPRLCSLPVLGLLGDENDLRKTENSARFTSGLVTPGDVCFNQENEIFIS